MKLLIILTLLVTPLAIVSQTLKADYQFQGNLNSSVAGAPAITNLSCGGSNSFVSDVVDGYTRQTVRFPFNCGLSVNTGGSLIPSNTYTIVVLFKVDAVSGFRRIVDFSNGLSDDGAYILDSRYEFEPTNTNPVILPSVYFQATLVREPSGTVRVYRDGVQRVTAADGGTFMISPANVLKFFQDDAAFGGEASAGNVARIRLFDGAMTTQQIGALDRLPNAQGGVDQSILFYSTRMGGQDIFTMNVDGSNHRRLTTDRVSFAATWSPDGSRIAFYGARDGNFEVYLMNSDGSGLQRMTNHPSFDGYPSWSPDGSRLAFESDRDGDNEIFVMDIATQTITQLTFNTGYDGDVTWSPDGGHMAFRANRDGDHEIFRMESDGDNPVQLTTNGVADAYPSWSPNGSRIAFSSDRNGVTEIYVMNHDGSNQTRVTNNSVVDNYPVWSPDSTRLMYSRTVNSSAVELVSSDLDGMGENVLTSSAFFNYFPDWRVGQLGSPCSLIPIAPNTSATGFIDASSCSLESNVGAGYTFNGALNQQIAVSVETSAFFARLELLSPSGTVLATAGGVNGVNNAYLPASGYITLPEAGTYTIRATAAFGGTGNYRISLYEAPAQACTYSLSPARTDVPMTGGTFSFEVNTQEGCPPAAAPAASGTFYTNASYTGGRVTLTMPPHPGIVDRQEVMTIAGQQHTIFQYCTCPPTNDFVDNPNLLQGANSPPNAPERGSNTNASSQSGEPAHAGNTPSKSVWYVWTAPSNGLWSFSTSGSSFDTVMAVYACPAGLDGCSFTNLTLVGSNDDTTFFDSTSKVNFRADRDKTYLIAIDGKNGASGTIELSWRQYERLFRLYLQTYNGTQSPLVPDSVTASNGSNTLIPTRVSLGVYEFNLPADGSTYIVTITGPTGIVWDPNNFPLDASFRQLDELMQGGGGIGLQNTVSNAQFALEHYISGYIKNITQAELTDLGVRIGSSRGPNPREDAPCTPLAFQAIAGVPYARYQCIARPNTLHDIIPNMSGKVFTVSVRSYDTPLVNNEIGLPSTGFIASNAPTFSVGGSVLVGGGGTRLDLTYTPLGLTQPISLRATTSPGGEYSFANLAAGSYSLKASRTGVVFAQPSAITLGPSQTIDISSDVACSFTPSNITTASVSGGLAQFDVSTNQPSCEWSAASDVPWITINSGAIVGNGPVHFTVEPNSGPGRIGSIRIQGRVEPVRIQQDTVNPTFGSITGRVLNAGGLALRNVQVTLVDSVGGRRTATTSSFGVYSFSNVQVGQIYTLTVSSRRFRFLPKTIVFTQPFVDEDFVGLE